MAEAPSVHRTPTGFVVVAGKLARGGVKAIVAKTFGDFVDRRETFGSAPPVFPAPVTPKTPVEDLGLVDHRKPLPGLGDEEFWFDYVADIGDGFNATFSIAERLAQHGMQRGTGETLDTFGAGPFADRLPDDAVLRQGRLLVMGGDQVYPAPVQTVEQDAYRDRTTGPYELALANQYLNEARRRAEP